MWCLYVKPHVAAIELSIMYLLLSMTDYLFVFAVLFLSLVLYTVLHTIKLHLF